MPERRGDAARAIAAEPPEQGRSIAYCNKMDKSSRLLDHLLAGLDTASGQVPAPTRLPPPLATVLLLCGNLGPVSIISDCAAFPA